MTLQKFALIAALARPLVATAKDAAPTKNAVVAKLSPAELQVLADVHQSDMFEVKAGKLALDKGDSPGVLSFGKMLVDEHSADARMILSMVEKLALALPEGTAITRVDVMGVARLDQLHGKQFDIEFLRAQIAGHDKTLARLDLQIAQLKDNADLVTMLKAIRPVVVMHRQKAQTLLASLGGNEQQRR